MGTKSEKAFEGLRKEFFDQLGWNALVNSCQKRQCAGYQDVFRDAAKGFETKGEFDLARSSRALQALTALRFILDDPRQPFHGWESMLGFALPKPQDFGEELLKIFSTLVAEATDPEFRARLADVCWCTLKTCDYKLVAIAIEAYLAAAQNLFAVVAGESHIDGLQRWEASALRLCRAAQLSKMDQLRIPIVQQSFDACLKEHLSVIPFLELGRILACYQNEFDGDSALLISLAEQCAGRAQNERQWGQFRHFLRLKANWEKKAGQLDRARNSEEQRAESYLNDAKDHLAHARPSYYGAACEVAHAITAYKEVSPKHSRIAELHRLMAEYREQSKGERQTFTYSIDTGIDRNAAARHVSGQPFLGAMQRLSLIAPPIDPKRARQAIDEQIHRSPFFALAQQDLIDEDGRVIAKRGAFLTDDKIIREKAIQAEMYRETINLIEIMVQGFIEPARRQLLLEHNFGGNDFYPALVDSPFIPPGREYFFARGLREGLLGDFVTGLHLLIPQLEHALRYHLEKRGVQITEINRNQVEEFMDMNALFNKRHGELVMLLGEDQTFELECLLVRRHGANLRNRFAHGLLSPQQFFHGSAIYLWWVTLRLCLWHLNFDPADATG